MYTDLNDLLCELDSLLYEATLDDGVWINKTEGLCIECLTGIECNSFLSGKTNWLQVIHAEDRQFIHDEVISKADYPRSLTQTYRIIHNERDDVAWVRDSKILSIYSGKVIARGIIVNITDCKNAEFRNKEIIGDLLVKANQF